MAISDVHTTPRSLQVTLSVADLPPGATLDPRSLTVTADGTPLQASARPVATSTQTRTAPVRESVLALDVSGSMAGDGIAAAKAAALSYAASLPSDVRVGLLTFSDVPHVLLVPTTDRAALRAAVEQVQAGGATALYDGILAAAHLMTKLPTGAERRLLVLSDGDDTASHSSLADATRELHADGIAADVVAFRLPGNLAALTTIATGSRGRVLPAASAADLAGAFSRAADAFRQELLVTAGIPASLAGRRVTLVVKVRAGGTTLQAISTLKLAGGIAVTVPTSQAKASAPAASTTPRSQLLIILALTFVGILAVALTSLFLPAMSHARAARHARFAEVNRYRVLGAMATAGPSLPAPAQDRGARAAVTQRTLSLVARTMRSPRQRERLASELDRAGLRMRPEEWAVIHLAAALVPAVVLLLATGSFIGFVIGGVLGWLAARVFVHTRISRRQAAFADQLPDTLQLLASSLRTGFSLSQAIGGVVREGTEPTASEFARALTEVRIGAELEDALDDVARRMDCEDLHWLVMAVRISREVGGNLAETLQTTVQTMRQRAELRGQVRVLSAEGRISARILTALPFVLAAGLALIRPAYLKPLFTHTAGIAMLCVGAVLLTVGSFWLSRIVKIKV
ncbi:MAG TPA: VWA domain-containing protein [Jatrophihabitans sp.]|nr:VWA domain-containing protein [Jatrophihabitans sp.]